MLIPDFFLPGVKLSAIDGGIPAYTTTNRKWWNGAGKGVSYDPTPMLKLVAGEFKLNHKIGVLENLPLFERATKYL